MCEIQISLRVGENLSNNDKKEFLKLMNKGARTNGDAYGIFSSDYLIKEGKSFNKKKQKIKKKAILKKIETNFLVGHNRYATLGKAENNKNNHPLETKKWIVAHNGCLWNYEDLAKTYSLKYKEKVDSAIISHLLEELETNIGETPLEAIISIAGLLEGSFSIVAYSKTDKCLYYFKNDRTYFYFSLIEDSKGKVILGSTNEESLNESYFEYDMIFPIEKFSKKITIEAKDNVIYRLNDKGIHKVGTFEEAEIKTVYGSSKNEDDYNGYNDTFDENDYKENGEKKSMNELFGKKYKEPNKKAYKTYTIDDWNDLYPNLITLMLRVEDDLKFTYNINQRVVNYKKGLIWFKCLNIKTKKEIKRMYPFAEMGKKGFVLGFDDMWAHLSYLLDEEQETHYENENYNEYGKVDTFNSYKEDNSLISVLEREIDKAQIKEEIVKEDNTDEEVIVELS